MTNAVISDGDDVMAGLVLVTLGEFLEDVALGVGQQVIGVAEGVGIIGNADRRIALGSKTRSGNDDIDRAEREPLVDISLLAELRRRIDIDLVAPAGPLVDLSRSPDRGGVERLRGFVDVRPFELGLRETYIGRGNQRCGGSSKYNRQFL